MDAAAFTRAKGGVVPVRSLRRAGHSEHAVARAVSTGVLVRVRRGWVAVPDADPYLIAAARAGVVVSCITQARRLGLWVLAGAEPHVAAPQHAGHVAALDATVHWAAPLVPRVPGALEDVLALVADCQPSERALVIWESALRRGMVDRVALARLPLGPKARTILADAHPFSDSGLESLFRDRLRWLQLPIIAQPWLAGHRVDFLIGDRLVFQIDGAHHVGAQREADIAHDARLMLLGYHVIRVGYTQVIDQWPSVQDLIMRAIAQGLHRAI
ncbi:DUF559 domain-containing protein [Micromonospora sp. DT81.3]|uniref:DUF559 domain-containing protein n=1 Tax=Micromonospora sp. DT81.3 TaxID=3416523 RepID=UPI003CEF48D6